VRCLTVRVSYFNNCGAHCRILSVFLMSLIRISYTALADFMNSSPTAQRKTLFDYKYPDEDEPKAKRLYYREARNTISAYHEGAKSPEWMQEAAARLADLAANNQSRATATRLTNNARALTAYARAYEADQIKLTQAFKGTLAFGNVEIRINADLHGLEKNKEKIIRLDYGKETPDAHYCAIVTQLMYESALATGLTLPTSAFVVRHIESKQDFAPARKGARLLRDITATCENIEGIWNTL